MNYTVTLSTAQIESLEILQTFEITYICRHTDRFAVKQIFFSSLFVCLFVFVLFCFYTYGALQSLDVMGS